MIELIPLLLEEGQQVDVSQRIKASLVNGESLNNNATSELFRVLPEIAHWQAELNLLQCFDYLCIETDMTEKLHCYLMSRLTADNKFIRAWAYNGLYVLASQHNEYLSQLKEILELGLTDQPPSVKARIRNILSSLA